MPISLQLQQSFRNYSRELFNQARRNLNDAFEQDPDVPEDTGNLKGSYREPNVIDFGARKSVIVSIEALSSEGTDYGDILERLPRIAPTTARALRWIGGDGQEVFSQGFTNVHFRWWTRWLDGGQVWTEALELAIQETEYRSA